MGNERKGSTYTADIKMLAGLIVYKIEEIKEVVSSRITTHPNL
jgi:hypothetical protein